MPSHAPNTATAALFSGDDKVALRLYSDGSQAVLLAALQPIYLVENPSRLLTEPVLDDR